MQSFRGNLPQLTPVTMGTGGITDPNNPDHARVARLGMEAGIWFHVADYGGGVYNVLERAFREGPRHIPRCIFKVDGTGPEQFRASVEDALRRTGVERIDIAQVCGNPVGPDLAPLAEALREAKEKGLVGSYIMDVIWPYSPKVIQAIEADLFDGYVFYYSPVDRELSEEANDLMISRDVSALAMRTFGGRDGGNYLTAAATHPTRVALEPVYRRSGCSSRVEFCVRFPLSLPHVRTTIGSTGNPQHLQEFLEAGRCFKPLPGDVIDDIRALHRQWDRARVL